MKIPIVLICDDNYIIPTSVAISSMISSKAPETYYEIYIVCASLSEESEAAFSVFASDSVAIHILREDADRFASLHQFSSSAICVASPSALLKFILPELLPQYDKVLYLDGDILVRTDLSELYATDLENNMVAAVIDSGSIYYKHKFTLLVEHYFNSGVMVLNLKQMRQENMTEALIHTKQELNDSNLMDQNVLNVVFDHRVKCLPIWYNFLAINLQRSRKKWDLSDINELYGTQFQSREELFDSWRILHFSSKDKPWKNPFVLFADKWMETYRSLPDQCQHIDSGTEQPQVTVIVVVHDDEGYLRQSLESILLQTLHETEIVCIANDTSEHTIDILRQYEQQDTRLRILYSNEQSVGQICNSSLANAVGKYVFFMDDSIVLSLDSLKKAWLTAEECLADVTLISGKYYDDKNRVVREKSEFLRRDLMPRQQIFNGQDAPNTIFTISSPVLWNKFYSRQFLLDTGLQLLPLRGFGSFYYASSSMALAERITAAESDLIYCRTNCSRNIQRDNSKDPLSFLYEINTFYQELTKRNLYEAFQTAFRHLSLSTISSHLRNGRDNEGRLLLLEALSREPYSQMPLQEIPEKDDGNHMVHWHSQQVTAARTWYEQSERIRSLATQNRDEWDEATHLPQQKGVSVSVIIPVYNTAPYLDETLACITGQTLSAIEIICVNDGSTDNSIEILNRWAAKDERLIILSQPNSRQGHARNVGIRRARGKYLYFMDSDDLLERNALEELVTIMEEKQLECLYFDGTTFFDDTNLADEFARFESNYIRSRSYDDVYDGPTLLRLFCEENKFIPNPSFQMLRTDFVRENRLMYPVGVIYEDNAFTFAALLHAKRASHVQRAYFMRRIRKDSTMTSELTFYNVYSYYIVFLNMAQTYFKMADSLAVENQNAAVSRMMAVLHNAQNDYAMLPLEYEGSEFGLRENLFVFQTLICDGGKRQIKKLNAQLGETKKKLQQTYDEKSEINRKLQITYGEKFDRGVQIRELNAQLKAAKKAQSDLKKQLNQTKKQLKASKKQNVAIKRSTSYRLGRILTWPVRRLKRLWKTRNKPG
ncbi:MAG: glycosyltransferase [Clostridiales bacterium]|nr:glycosyltransferase [Clostridiales bacterium]